QQTFVAAGTANPDWPRNGLGINSYDKPKTNQKRCPSNLKRHPCLNPQPSKLNPILRSHSQQLPLRPQPVLLGISILPTALHPVPLRKLGNLLVRRRTARRDINRL